MNMRWWFVWSWVILSYTVLLLYGNSFQLSINYLSCVCIYLSIYPSDQRGSAGWHHLCPLYRPPPPVSAQGGGLHSASVLWYSRALARQLLPLGQYYPHRSMNRVGSSGRRVGSLGRRVGSSGRRVGSPGRRVGSGHAVIVIRLIRCQTYPVASELANRLCRTRAIIIPRPWPDLSPVMSSTAPTSHDQMCRNISYYSSCLLEISWYCLCMQVRTLSLQKK